MSNTTITDVSFNHPYYSLVHNDRIVRNGDAPTHSANEEEEIIKEIGRYVEAKIINIYGFYAISIPNEDSNPSTTILASNDWLIKNKLLIIIQNASGSLLGIFSRSICLEQGISKGSVLPYIERALSADYGIIILRPNTNSVIETIEGEGAHKIPIPGSESPEIHSLCVWENVISKSENVNHIALLGYANGASLCKDIYLRQMVQSHNDVRANLIKSFITIEASHIIETDDAADIHDELGKIAVNLECNQAPKGFKLEYRKEKLGCTSISLGLPKGVNEVSNVGASITLAIGPVFKYLQLAEGEGNIPELFAITLANENGYDPKTAVVTINPIVDTNNTDNSLLNTTPKAKFFRRLTAYIGIRSTDKPEETSALDASSKLTVNDFDLLKLVGKGAFGKVMLVRKKKGNFAGNIYAMKVLKKSMIIEKNQIEHAKSERDILFEIKHPFIVRLRFAFQNDDKLYLVTDYYNGGTLFYHLRKSLCFTESRSKFYAAELLLALDHLHSQHIIYRDLKLENVLLDHLGHVALTDFGLSKQNIDKTGGANTFCGTPDYVAPELLRGQKYGKAVDWWSFGVLLFEMIQGQTPFFDKNRTLMFHRIVKENVKIPSTFSPQAADCINGLLNRNYNLRLGCGGNGALDIMSNPFFASIDFVKLFNREITPPYKPEVITEQDTKYVPKFFLDTKAVDSVAKNSNGTGNKNNTQFESFTYAGDNQIDS